MKHRLTKFEGTTCSICEDFVDTEIEFVTAHQVTRSGIWGPGVPLHDHLISRCSANRFDVVLFLDRVLVFDHIIGNTNRHMNNFETVCDADTLEWLCPTTLFDNGTGMGCDLLTAGIVLGLDMDCKPFSDYWPRQICLVGNLSWFDPDRAIDGLRATGEMFSSVRAYGDMGRDTAIVSFLESRVEDPTRLAGFCTQTP